MAEREGMKVKQRVYLPWVWRGGPESGNFDHEGRPGEVGGSSTSAALPERIDSWKDAVHKEDWPRGLFVKGDVMVDVYAGDGNGHVDYAEKNKDAMGITDDPEGNFLDPFKDGWDRIDIVDIVPGKSWALSVQTASANTAELHRLQALINNGSLPGIGEIFIEADNGEGGFDLAEFLVADKLFAREEELILRAIIRGGPGSGNYDHEGRPGFDIENTRMQIGRGFWSDVFKFFSNLFIPGRKAPEQPITEEWILGNGPVHCPKCIEFSEMGEMPLGFFPMQRTETTYCEEACTCTMDYSDGQDHDDVLRYDDWASWEASTGG